MIVKVMVKIVARMKKIFKRVNLVNRCYFRAKSADRRAEMLTTRFSAEVLHHLVLRPLLQ